MKIFFDHQIFTLQKYGGVSRYFTEIMTRMPKDSWYTSTVFTENEYVDNLQLFKCKHLYPKFKFKGRERVLTTFGNFFSIKDILFKDFDLFHQTDYNPYCIPYLKRKKIPFITTCHDLNFATINKVDYLMRWQKKSMCEADGIIAISEYTKCKLIDLWDIPEDKITVIHHGVSKHSSVSEARLIRYPYLLYVGTRFKFKNFTFLVSAYSLLVKKFPSLKLICTGSAFTEKELELFRSLNLSEKIIHIAASETGLRNLYHYAEAFIFPSLSEGFGMPLLEAMAEDCPVLCSNASCFPEIAGNAALYFDPYEIDDLYSQLERILIDSEYRKVMINRGKARVNEFSWDKTADLHMDFYRKFI